MEKEPRDEGEGNFDFCLYNTGTLLKNFKQEGIKIKFTSQDTLYLLWGNQLGGHCIV